MFLQGLPCALNQVWYKLYEFILHCLLFIFDIYQIYLRMSYTHYLWNTWELTSCCESFGLLNWGHRTQRRWGWSRTFISRYYRTGKDERSTLNMATRCLFRTVLNSFAGLNLGATNGQKWINVPRISSAAIQCRGLRQGEVKWYSVELAGVAC